MFGTPFEIFGTVHLITIASIIIVSVFLPKIYKNKSNDQKAMMKKFIAAVIAGLLLNLRSLAFGVVMAPSLQGSLYGEH